MKTTEVQARATKPSGIPWLGEVPAHWEVKRLKHVAKLRSGEAITVDAIEEEGNYPVFGGNGLRGFTEDYTHEGDYALIGRQGALCGNVNYAHGKFWASEHAVVCHPVGEVDHIWLGELLRSMDLGQYSQSAAQPGLAVERIEALLVPAPPLPEQRAIAAFLDERTARIDALVARKRRLVQLLKEKRQALITRAVTRGLDPKVKMKESGVPWLGEVPVGWALRPLKQLVSEPITDGPHETPEFVDEGVPFVSAEAVWDGTIHMESIRGYITREDHERYARKYLPRRNDIYMVKSGSTTGRIAIVDFDTEFNIWSPLAAIRCNEVLAHHRFIYHAMSSDYFQKQVQTRWSFGTQPNIGMGVIGNLVIALPDRRIQEALCDYIDKGVTRLDALVTKVEQAVERLQEYRTALISAAVTGKVRVG